MNTSGIPPSVSPETVPAEFETLIGDFQHASGVLLNPRPVEERPLYGQTLYIADCPLETRFGPFHAYIFQDIIDKHYIIALAHGDVTHASRLYTRVHSSCVTSETLRGCDCDCVQQLEGAFKVIAEKGAGVLFYLMQEGRGVGYVGKARDRMLVQASQDHLSTFQAYACMGLKKDHRNYDNISQICWLLGLTAPFVVLTNNSDKVEALRAQGLTVLGMEPLEFEPSPFNLAYLASKAAAGHHLRRPAETAVRRAVPPDRVAPFRPHALPTARRFIYAASYHLPVKPVDNDILLTTDQFQALFPNGDFERALAAPAPAVRRYTLLRDHRVFVRIEPEVLAERTRTDPADALGVLLTTPYWFQVHVYYDLVTSQDFVVLTHGRPRLHDIPVVRLHSESLFNRFPLRSVVNRDKFKQAVKHIVAYGVGAVILLYNDGRGAGFGAHATDRMLTGSGLALSSDEAYRQLGVGYDSRDYDAALRLLRRHVPGSKIQMVMNSPTSLVRKTEYSAALNAHHLDVEKWIFLDDSTVAE